MSCNVPSFLTTDISSIVVENSSRKKSKRKKRKNKQYKHSHLNKKNSKCFRQNSSGPSLYSKSRQSQSFKPESRNRWKIMSNWYWSNYKKAFEWQDKHKIAHWKACAFALQEENRCLMQLINSMQPGKCPKLPVTMNDLHKSMNYKQPEVKHNEINKDDSECSMDEEECEDEYEFEMSEEMMKFFEKSFKHKMDLQRLKEEKKTSEEEKEVAKIQTNRLKRSEEMQLLYGDAASMITGMETAVQLSFDKFCDTKSPKFWPNIPLRL